ncbi:MAG: histone deacetylase [Chloroflexi bacterium]|nr:histone deacetylase [Chloroflexota bacterium]
MALPITLTQPGRRSLSLNLHTSLDTTPLSREELSLVHSIKHISQIEKVAQSGGGWLDADTVMSPASYKVALYAVGGVLNAVDAVMERKIDSAFALVRPPGHHATRTRAMGFCLFNNIAIAARQSMRKYDLDRVLIVDFDVHHGNGTQDAFYDDPAVLYFSTHLYPFYPGTGRMDEVGVGKGIGTTANVPLPAWCGDEEYMQVFQQILVPLAHRFQPQLILVSAGYDAHWLDPIGSMQLSVSGFAQMVQLLQKLALKLCQGRLVFTLEGGYHLPALARSVKATLEVLLGEVEVDDPLGKPLQGRKAPAVETIIQEVKTLHKLG